MQLDSVGTRRKKNTRGRGHARRQVVFQVSTFVDIRYAALLTGKEQNFGQKLLLYCTYTKHRFRVGKQTPNCWLNRVLQLECSFANPQNRLDDEIPAKMCVFFQTLIFC
jgi:hypothetical protein